jgi:hypothetical protein
VKWTGTSWHQYTVWVKAAKQDNDAHTLDTAVATPHYILCVLPGNRAYYKEMQNYASAMIQEPPYA